MADDKWILRIGGTTKDLDAALKRANAGLSKFKDAIFSLKGAIAGFGVAKLTQNIVDANIEWQKIHYTLLAVTGSTKTANSEFEFVRQTSDKLGLSLQDAAQGYARLAASAYGAGVTTQQLHTAFTGLSEAFTVLHTPAQDTQRVIYQLEQTLSKGKVQTQDLMQISNSLPGVFELAAKAFGVTGAKFQQMLSNGMVPASEFLTKFAQQLHDEYGGTASKAVDSLNSQINLLHNAMFDLATQAGNAGFITSYTHSIQDLTTALKDPALQEGLRNLIVGFGKVIEAVTKGTAAVSRFVTEIGQGLAISASGTAGFGALADSYEQPIRKLRTEIGHLKEVVNAPEWQRSQMSAAFGAQMPEWTKNTDKLKVKLADLEAQLKKLEAAQLDALTSGAGTKPATKTGSGTTVSGAGGAPKANPNQTQIETILLQLKQQASEYGKSGTAVALYRLQLAHATPAELEQAKALAATIDTLKRQVQAEKLAASAKQKAAQLAKQHAQALDQEAQALKDQLDPMEPLRREMAQYDELLKTGRITQDEWAAATFKVNEQMDALNNTVAKTGKTAKKSTSEVNQFAVQAARNIQGIISNTLESGFQGGIKSIVTSFEKALRQMAAQAAAADLGRRLFGNMGGASGGGSSDTWGWVGQIANFAATHFAKGGVFDGSGLQRLALGGITTGPTPFMSKSGPGLMGEAGPEGILPLARDKSGKLGVRGGGGITINPTYNFYTTESAKSAKQAKGQIASDLNQTMLDAARRYS